jgi:beta-lactamase superfamily II metal-dependent hydrolase
MSRLAAVIASVLALVWVSGPSASIARPTLDIYFIDVEGGQSTLMVTPAGQALLVDTGYGAVSGRDSTRIVAAARDAGVTALDYLLITHFHSDHVGGAPEVLDRLPAGTLIDYGEPAETVASVLGPFNAYKALRDRGPHLRPRPGDRLPLTGLDVDVLSSGGSVLARPLTGAAGAGQANARCAGLGELTDAPTENPRSLGVRVRFGAFTFLDLGDLSGRTLAALACPTNIIGHVDLYLVPHHGNEDTAIPAVVAAVSPRVAVVNNGAIKGGDARAFEVLRAASGLQATWQLHKTARPGARNFPDEFIANLEDGASDAGAWIKVSARENGSFTVTNGRTGLSRTYQ